ncbi:hypothetical protein CRG98_000764 [Punica granatum]|uniref:Uncharacterized protein n=1 Tax=Punica granatum TaxID=22663 RepID=A0A2I0LDU4_PUNGR|nr:hypothetical protein CRG98_000764 [Punica granatum]
MQESRITSLQQTLTPTETQTSPVAHPTPCKEYNIPDFTSCTNTLILILMAFTSFHPNSRNAPSKTQQHHRNEKTQPTTIPKLIVNNQPTPTPKPTVNPQDTPPPMEPTDLESSLADIFHSRMSMTHDQEAIDLPTVRTRISFRRDPHACDNAHDLGVSTFSWGRVMDTHEKESPLPIYNLKVEGR